MQYAMPSKLDCTPSVIDSEGRFLHYPAKKKQARRCHLARPTYFPPFLDGILCLTKLCAKLNNQPYCTCRNLPRSKKIGKIVEFFNTHKIHQKGSLFYQIHIEIIKNYVS